MTEPAGPGDAAALPQVAIGGAAAAALADLGSVAADVDFARDAALRYAVLAEQRDVADPLVARALWNAAAISYRRAFGSGKALLGERRARLRLDRKVVSESGHLTVQQREAHDLTLKLADRHVAHRVDDTEDARVVAMLAPPPAQQVVGLGVLAVNFLGPDAEVARTLAEVCELLLEPIHREIATRRESLLQELVEDPDPRRFYEAARPAQAVARPEEPNEGGAASTPSQ